MKRIITYALLLCALAVSPAQAVTRWSYNPTTFSPIRVLSQWAIGNQRIALVTTHSWVQNGPCWEKVFAVTSVWYNHFTHETTVQIDGQTVTETQCP